MRVRRSSVRVSRASVSAGLAEFHRALCTEMSSNDAARATDYELALRIANRRRARRGLPGPATEAEIAAILEAM